MLREHLRRLADQHRHIGFDSKRFDDAMALHQTAIVLDLHLDSLLSACLFDFDLREEHSLDWKPKRHVVVDRLGDVIQRGKHRSGYNHSDAPRMVKGGLNGAVFGFTGGPSRCCGSATRTTGHKREHGAVYLTLNHQTDTDASANGWSFLPWDRDADRTEDKPMSEFGERVVAACNEAGVIIDVSHTIPAHARCVQVEQDAGDRFAHCAAHRTRRNR